MKEEPQTVSAELQGKQETISSPPNDLMHLFSATEV
jgi:hypothetical protein